MPTISVHGIITVIQGVFSRTAAAKNLVMASRRVIVATYKRWLQQAYVFSKPILCVQLKGEEDAENKARFVRRRQPRVAAATSASTWDMSERSSYLARPSRGDKKLQSHGVLVDDAAKGSVPILYLQARGLHPTHV